MGVIVAHVIYFLLACLGAFTLGGWCRAWWDHRRERRAASEQTWQDTTEAREIARDEGIGASASGVFTGRTQVLSDGPYATVTAFELTPEAKAALSTNGARIPSPITPKSKSAAAKTRAAIKKRKRK